MSNLPTFEEELEAFAVEYEAVSVVADHARGRILKAAQARYARVGNPHGRMTFESWVNTRLKISKKTAQQQMEHYEITNELIGIHGSQINISQRNARDIAKFKRKEPEVYEEVMKTAETAEQAVKTLQEHIQEAKEEQARVEELLSRPEVQEKARLDVEATRSDPNETVAGRLANASMIISLPYNEDEVTSQRLAEQLRCHINSDTDRVAFSVLRQKINLALDILGVD